MIPPSTKPNRWRPITVFNLLLGLLFSLSALAQPVFLKEGLVAYYPFNGNANDESGNFDNLLPKGVVFPANDRFGNVSKAFSFNGINSQQQPGMPKGSDLHLPINSSQRTVTAWFKAKSIGNAEIIFHWGGAANRKRLLRYGWLK